MTILGRAGGFELALADTDLELLEATRHAIVHNGGRADEPFIRRTQSKLALGQPLEIEQSAVDRMRGAAMSAGCRMIDGADRLLQVADT